MDRDETIRNVAKFVVDKPGRYRRRDGKEVWVRAAMPQDSWAIKWKWVQQDNANAWREDGAYSGGGTPLPHDMDLVEYIGPLRKALGLAGM